MTSPSIPSQTVPAASRPNQSSQAQSTFRRLGVPALLFLVTLVTTTAVGMRYMHNFRLGNPPLALADDSDILPYTWVIHHLNLLATGLPFSLTLVGILLTHEFGHYFACRYYAVRSTLPLMLPAPSLSGTFGAVIRLKSSIRSRAALIAIGAAGPIAGFLVAMLTVTLGLSLSTYATVPMVQKVQAPLAILIMQRILQLLTGTTRDITLIIPHPILTASWIGLLITALNLIPAGQLDGGHILYAISPRLHRWSSRLVVVALFALGLWYWTGWIAWGVVLMMPGMRHPAVPDTIPMGKWHLALIPACLLILVVAGTFEPFQGYGLINIIEELFGHQ
jgi:membrane-associated protease RseP (regulator of RpoE activity)